MSTKHEQIEGLKQELMDRYVILMLIIISFYIFVFIFYVQDKIMPWYLGAEFLFIGYTYSLMRGRFLKTTIVHLYLITAPLYNLYIILAFWNNSVASFCWFLPIPLGAYIFFTKKEVIIYLIYTLLIILSSYLIINNFSFDFPQHTQKEVIFTDTIIIISNILVVTLLIYYKDKIRNLEMTSQFENSEVSTLNPQKK